MRKKCKLPESNRKFSSLSSGAKEVFQPVNWEDLKVKTRVNRKVPRTPKPGSYEFARARFPPHKYDPYCVATCPVCKQRSIYRVARSYRCRSCRRSFRHNALHVAPSDTFSKKDLALGRFRQLESIGKAEGFVSAYDISEGVQEAAYTGGMVRGSRAEDKIKQRQFNSATFCPQSEMGKASPVTNSPEEEAKRRRQHKELAAFRLLLPKSGVLLGSKGGSVVSHKQIRRSFGRKWTAAMALVDDAVSEGSLDRFKVGSTFSKKMVVFAGVDACCTKVDQEISDKQAWYAKYANGYTYALHSTWADIFQDSLKDLGIPVAELHGVDGRSVFAVKFPGRTKSVWAVVTVTAQSELVDKPLVQVAAMNASGWWRTVKAHYTGPLAVVVPVLLCVDANPKARAKAKELGVWFADLGEKYVPRMILEILGEDKYRHIFPDTRKARHGQSPESWFRWKICAKFKKILRGIGKVKIILGLTDLLDGPLGLGMAPPGQTSLSMLDSSGPRAEFLGSGDG